ncbi:MAG TPA: iron-containing alcohol dehydrogenase [Pseudogracilibacillus sp.]|nr:iron-containing alcohol dehydrogenase [Pseudogracilibacillus sp.]
MLHKSIFYRSYQRIIKVASKFFAWREPKVLNGEGSIKQLPELIKKQNNESVLIITDKGIISAGLLDELLKGLDKAKIQYAIYDKTVPNPIIENIEEAVYMYHINYCDGIIAFGGGSAIDCAKGAGARIAKPGQPIAKMRGLLKIGKELPPMFVVPTTAGTGAEATLAAVISNNYTHEKYPLMDTSLIPDYAVLDPLLTVNLPAHITSTTGMDTLTHAVEAYIGKGNTKQTKQWSIQATKLVFENLYETYANGKNNIARKQMQKAAYLAGMAFTRAYVGYVHAIAHTLGGFYNTPHGLANAIILPHVLEYYGKSVHQPLAELADAINISRPDDTNEQKANKFIEAIKELNNRMDIPNRVDGIIDSDIPTMVQRALEEGNPLYPVPKILFEEDIAKLFQTIKA